MDKINEIGDTIRGRMKLKSYVKKRSAEVKDNDDYGVDDRGMKYHVKMIMGVGRAKNRLKEGNESMSFSKFAEQQDATSFKNAFDELLSTKIADRLEALKADVAAKIFNHSGVTDGNDTSEVK